MAEPKPLTDEELDLYDAMSVLRFIIERDQWTPLTKPQAKALIAHVEKLKKKQTRRSRS